MKFLLSLLLCLGFSLSVSAQQGKCISGDCLNGSGVFRFSDGAEYRGTFNRGKFMDTNGILRFPDKSYYAGGWRFSLQEGEGRMQEANGTNYVGGWHNGRRHGEGEIVYKNGNRVNAFWAYDKIAGTAKFSFANKDFYTGEMLYDQAAGYITAGQGRMEYANGDLYEGQWAGGLRHGTGKMIFEDRTEIAGLWEDDQFQADWSTIGFQGDRNTVADCNNGCPDGRGKYAYPDGTVFYGMVKDGSPAGNGTVVYPDGNTYHGSFIGHRNNGLGVMYYADGEIHGGIWQNGTMYRRLFEAVGRPAQSVAVNFDPEVKVWAVVVGAARYTHMRTLKYTDDDAYHVYAFLKSVEGGALPDNQVKVLIDDDATHRNIIMAMRETYQRADENDVILFYFSGHGLPGAFLPVDYDGFANRLEHYQLRDELLASRAKHKLVIADACHSGSLGGRSTQGAIAFNSKGNGADAALNAYYDALNNAQASTALLLSSKGEEISLEDGGLRSGIFSHFLIRGMKGEADDNGDRLVSIQELFSFVHREVRRYTGNIQTPTLTGTFDELMPVSVMRR
ncbi:MAG: hypothetical protein ACJAZ9_000677 [Neolewinella sp.]|jgi:hypothetical protein